MTPVATCAGGGYLLRQQFMSTRAQYFGGELLCQYGIQFDEPDIRIHLRAPCDIVGDLAIRTVGRRTAGHQGELTAEVRNPLEKAHIPSPIKQLHHDGTAYRLTLVEDHRAAARSLCAPDESADQQLTGQPGIHAPAPA